MLKIVAAIQVRYASKRVPGKVVRDVLGEPLLWHIYRRLQCVPGLDAVTVMMGDWSEPISTVCMRYGMEYTFGKDSDVLGRMRRTCDDSRADALVRVTGDCLWHDPGLLGRILADYRKWYPMMRGLSTWHPARSLSEGVDLEIYSRDLLLELDRNKDCPREDVATWAAKEGRLARWEAEAPFGEDLHMSLDTEEDFERAERVMEKLGRLNWNYFDAVRAYRSDECS